LDHPRTLAPIELADGAREIAVAHQRHHHIGIRGAVRHGDIEMLNARADVGDNLGDLRAAIGPGVAVHTDPHRPVELADAVHLAGQVQFGAEGGLEKALRDLGVAERLALGGAPAADLVVLGGGGEGRRGCECKGDDDGGLHGCDNWPTSRHLHGGRRSVPQ
jgi:hypothetical protein